MDGKKFINNFRNIRLNPFLPSSPSSLIARGDIQKRNRARQIAQGGIDNLKIMSKHKKRYQQFQKHHLFIIKTQR